MPSQMRFPRLEQVELRSFSLYSNRPELMLALDLPVFCLAGANGLGKSTFLNAITYGLTGVIPNPDDRFDSIEEHYRHNLPYAKRYFEGRINELDHDSAEVALRFRLGDNTYSLSRSIFDTEALRRLEVKSSRRTLISAERRLSDGERHEAYVDQLLKDTGLAQFEQYVFLQHFVFSFDERRRLLFWEGKLVEQALFLAFGISGDEAKQADNWRREAEKLDSQARNLQYQATTARRRLKEIAALTGDESEEDDNLVEQYQRLLVGRKEKTELARRATLAYEDAVLAQQRAKAEELAVRNEYEQAFGAHLTALRRPADHPVVRSVLDHDNCLLCGSAGEGLELVVSEKLKARTCPLCESPLEDANGEQQQALKEAKEIGRVLEKLEKVSADKRAAVKRLEKEAGEAQDGADAAATALAEFEAKNEGLPDLVVAAGTGLDEIVKQLESEIKDATTRRDNFRARRDVTRKKLRESQAQLARNYRDAEADFLPLFTELAQSFLGLDIELQLDVKSSEVELVLAVQGGRRRLVDQLSESQRYFVDIALRMALTRHMAAGPGWATLFIDTPEGSLDVAYESRAGSMFAQYVEAKKNIVMTANLNASQLIRELARECGHRKMKVVRMIEWADLSDVQAEAEELFESAYATIEKELGQGPG